MADFVGFRPVPSGQNVIRPVHDRIPGATRDELVELERRTRVEFSVLPSEESAAVFLGLDDERRCPRVGEPLFVDRDVVCREEDVHPGMRVVPADDELAQKLPRDLFRQMRPGIQRESEMNIGRFDEVRSG